MANQDPTVFIGSSSEGKAYADELQVALEDVCEATVWDQGAFGLSESGLSALYGESQRVDFAILVLTPDDITVTRGQQRHAVRDNVIFEAGLFAGALSPQRTFLVRPNDVEVDLPSDLNGITTCTFRSSRSDGNVRAAVSTAATKIRGAMTAAGPKGTQRPPAVEATDLHPTSRSLDEERAELTRELDALVVAAEAQGWTVKTRTDSVLRLLSQTGDRYSFSVGSPRETRHALREYAKTLNEQGIRMNRTLLLPVDTIPPPATARGTEKAAQRPNGPAPRRRTTSSKPRTTGR